MRKALAVCAAVGALTVAGSAAVIPVRAGDVVVTATYKGKGPVDEKHAIIVFLFDHPMPTAESRPLGREVIAKNGGSAKFAAVAASPVYVTVVYDEKSNYAGIDGPPPAGTPIGRPMKDGKPVAVTPGPSTKISVTFDDSQRWK